MIREYQKECIDIISNKGDGKWLIQMATGLGKGYIMPYINWQGKTLFIAHRTGIVEQNAEYMPEHTHYTIQKLAHEYKQMSKTEFRNICIDEAHRYSNNKWSEIIKYFEPKRIIGFTATPNRSDNKSLKEIFDEIIYEKDIVFGIKNNYLTKIHCERINIHYDLTNVNISNGDYVIKGLAEAVNVESAIQAIKEIYNKAPKPALIFAVNIEHAESIAKACNIPCAHSKIKKQEIINTINNFKTGKLEGLVSVEMFTEGINLNNAISLIMARPTQSELLYVQIVGRIVRKHEGKNKAYLFDCVGATKHPLCTAPTLLGLDTDAISKTDEAKLIGDLIDDIPEIIKNQSNKPQSWIKNREIVNLFAKKHKLNLYGINFIKHPDGSIICSLPENKWIGMSKINHIKQARMISSKKLIHPLKDPQEIINDIVGILNKFANDSKALWYIKKTYRWGKEQATDKQKIYIKRLLNSTPHRNFDTSRLNKFEAATIISRLKLDKH